MEISHKIAEEEIFQNFCFDRGIRQGTIKGYRDALGKYSSFMSKTLEALIIEAENEEDSGIRLKRRKINKYLRDFEVHLNESGLSESTVRQIVLLVKAFYRHNEIEVPRIMKTGVRKVRMQETMDNLPTMEEIRRLMEHCNSVYRAMIVLSLSSGMGSSEVTSLTFEHLYRAIGIKIPPEGLDQLIGYLKDREYFIPTWNIVRIKKDFEYTTFSSPESIERLYIYLEELHNKYPDYKPKLTDKIFRSLRTNKRLTANDYCGIFVYKNKAHFFRKTKDNRNLLKTHTLRKFFASTLERNGVPHLTTRRLLGHSVDSTTSAYFKVDIEALKEDYSRVVSELTTDHKTVVVDKYQDLKQEMDTLKGLVIEHGKLPEEYRDLILRDVMETEARQ